jgi:hypothetical protein
MMPLRRVLLISLFILSLVGLAAVVTSAPLACEGQPVDTELHPVPGQQILGDRIISQSFVAPRNGLNRIDLFLQTYQRQNRQAVTVRLLEVPEGSPNPLQGTERFRATFNAATVTDQAWRSFTLAPIPDSAGKTYLIALESPESVDGDAITIGGIERDLYPRGTAFLGMMPVLADLSFRTCYQMPFSEKLQVLSEQITQNRPGLWENTTFYWLSFLFYGLVLIGFFWKLAGRIW